MVTIIILNDGSIIVIFKVSLIILFFEMPLVCALLGHYIHNFQTCTRLG